MKQKQCARKPIVLWLSLLLVCLAVTVITPTIASASTPTVWVGPPSGADDTANIQSALDQCMTLYPHGCTVQFGVGTYYSQQVIAENFHGAVRGMGMEATVVEVIAPLVVTISDENVADHPPSRTNKYPILMTFLAGDITVSDISFKVTAYNATTPWWYGGAGPNQTWMEAFVGVVSLTTANLLIQRVAFEGAPGTGDNMWNLNNGPLYWGSTSGPVTGTFKVVSSRFKDISNSFEVYWILNSQIIIGGSPQDGNVVEDCELGGVVLDADNSVFQYSHNNVQAVTDNGWAGLFIWQGALHMPQKPTQFIVQQNTIAAIGYNQDGIFVFDNGPASGAGKTANLIVTDNTIQMSASEVGPAFSAIQPMYTEGTLILNNRISGAAENGISLWGSTQSAAIGNDLNHFTADPAGGLGDIYLDPATSNDLVVCAEPTDTVVNQGNNNIIIGCQQPAASPEAATNAAPANNAASRPAAPTGKIPRLP